MTGTLDAMTGTENPYRPPSVPRRVPVDRRTLVARLLFVVTAALLASVTVQGGPAWAIGILLFLMLSLAVSKDT